MSKLKKSSSRKNLESSNENDTVSKSRLESAREQLQVFIAGCARVSDQMGFKNLRDNGQQFRGEALPERVQRGQPRQCFNNAFNLLGTLRGDHYYAEGWAVSTVAIIPIHHGWIVTPDGGVIDPTWDAPERCAYFGFAFGPDIVSMMCAVSYPGVFDNPRLFRLPDAQERIMAGIVKLNVRGVETAPIGHGASIEKCSCNPEEPR